MTVQIPEGIGYAGGKMHLLEGTLRDLAAGIDAAQAAAEGASVKGETSVETLRIGHVTLNGVNPTRVAFRTPKVAAVTGTNDGPFNLGAGNTTMILTPEGQAPETITFSAAAGKHDGGANPATTIVGLVDTKISIAVDAEVGSETFHEITLDPAGKNTGALIAAELQAKIRALGGAYANVTAAFSVDKYVITSATKGTGSKVRIARAAGGNLTEELKIGPDGGTDTDGTGFAVNAAAATAQEVVDKLNADGSAYFSAEVVGAKVKLVGTVATAAGRLIVANGSSNTALGFSDNTTHGGAAGLGYASDMQDTNYEVMATVRGTKVAANIAAKGLSVADQTTSEFSVYCETDAATDVVGLMIAGKVA